MDNISDEDIKSAYEKSTPIDNDVIRLSVTPNRIVLMEFAKPRVFENNFDDYYRGAIFRALSATYYELKTNTNNYPQSKLVEFCSSIDPFLNWLNLTCPDQEDVFNIITNFQVYRQNINKVKNDRAKNVLMFLKISLGLKNMKWQDLDFIRGLTKSTKLVNTVQEQTNLSHYLAEFTWMRPLLGDALYNRIASPKRLMNSFIVTISTALIEIQKSIVALEEIFLKNDYPARKFYNVRQVGKQDKITAQKGINMLKGICNFSGSSFNDLLSEVLFYDLVRPKHRSCTKQLLINNHTLSLVNRDIDKSYICRTPYIFTEEIVSLVSQRAEARKSGLDDKVLNAKFPLPVTKVENYLFAMICGWLTIQQSDIAKLRGNHFKKIKNSTGKTRAIICDYYKGRSKGVHYTDQISTSFIEGEAILSYLDKRELSKTESGLLIDGINLTSFRMNFSGLDVDFCGRLFDLISASSVNEKVNYQLTKRKFTRVFLEAISTLINKNDESYSEWLSRTNEERKRDNLSPLKNESENKKISNTIYSQYWNEVNKTTPKMWFTPNLIKTTSVHSRTDKFLDGHLDTRNSHTNETEKLGYMTPYNQEWVNRYGLVTRHVMNDIANNVYYPTIELFEETMLLRTVELQLRTEVVTESTGTVNNLGIIDDHNEDDILPDSLIVLDTPETVMIFIHFLKQAEEKYPQLIKSNLEFVEKELLPRCNWMSTLLSTALSKENVRIGKEEYEKYQSFYPSLFNAQ
ncbi:hypothetical protein FGD67_21415 [Colwellia sp. M166]|uniref:hypothetical protein n=1 Tax=Colwellia sp. M166 TaxID=2583805 RepID=UPI00211DEC30|nr:hypothetical protein [Colwellia sp. M166]UUO25490.1 hypothetical protein FGD67_21415 [Colwellia sp. M166]